MLYCYLKGVDLFKKEQMLSKKLGLYICYDEKSDTFQDENGNILSIEGENIFPRTGALQAKDLISKISSHGGIPINGILDFDKQLEWPKYIKTKRRLLFISGEYLLFDTEGILDSINGDSVFLKTCEKNYSGVVEKSKLLDPEGVYRKALDAHKDDYFLIGDEVNICSDDYGNIEYRAFVIDGEIFNISRIHDYLYHKVGNDVIDYVKSCVSELIKNGFARNFVIDIFAYTKDGKREFDVLECNPIEASGIYLYNSVYNRGNLNHTHPVSDISDENKYYTDTSLYSFDSDIKGTPSILYNLPGGFAADLATLSLMGTLSGGYSMLHFDGEHNFDLNRLAMSEIFSDDTHTITSDADLSGSPLKLKKSKL